MFLLPHVGVAGFVEHDLGQFVVRGGFALRPPAVECGDEIAQGLPRFWFELLGRSDGARRFHQRNAGRARAIVQQLDGGIAQPAFGHIDDALEREVVGRLIDQPQVSERITDLGALVEARSADHPIRQSERDKAILELAHLKRGAYQDGDFVERMTLALQLLDVLAKRARLLFGVPGRGDGDFFAVLVLGAQCLAEPALVVGDQV
jgi:hypothetical protein